VFVGGSGSDVMKGGTSDNATDTFMFNSVTETLTGTKRDKIYDFISHIDKIDLLTIDANSALAGNQAFRFGGTAAKANSIWYKSGEVDNNSATKDIIIYGDVNGNTTADFEIGLVGFTGVISIDFIL
jgi:hypothetical protein